MHVMTLTSSGMITLPAKIRQRYDLQPGDKVVIVDSPEGLLLIPIIPLEKLQNPAEKAIAAKICRDLALERRAERQAEDSL